MQRIDGLAALYGSADGMQRARTGNFEAKTSVLLRTLDSYPTSPRSQSEAGPKLDLGSAYQDGPRWQPSRG